MGQYYRPIILTKGKRSIVGYWDGNKLMESLKLTGHSYIGNRLCNCVENYLISKGGGRVVWAGDYADKEKGKDENLFDLAKKKNKEFKHYDWAGKSDIRYLVNVDKKQYIDLWKLVSIDNLVIHPLPLLTAEGNDISNGGDYDGIDYKYVGTWARDFIKILRNYQAYEIIGYEEIRPVFVEQETLREKLSIMADLIDKSLNDDTYNYADNERYVNSIKNSLSRIRKALPKKKKEEVKAAAGNGIPSD